ATLNRKELAVDRAAKAESITELSGLFKTSNVVVVAHYSGLTVAQMQTLRKQMKQAGAQVKVAKNRLAKIALKDTDAASIAPLLKGPTVLAYSGDPVARRRWPPTSLRRTRRSSFLADPWARLLWTPMASRRSPPCRHWTNCAPRSSACSRLRRPKSRSSQMLPRRKLRVWSRPMPRRTRRLDGSTLILWFEPIGIEQWLTCKKSSMNCLA